MKWLKYGKLILQRLGGSTETLAVFRLSEQASALSCPGFMLLIPKGHYKKSYLPMEVTDTYELNICWTTNFKMPELLFFPFQGRNEIDISKSRPLFTNQHLKGRVRYSFQKCSVNYIYHSWWESCYFLCTEKDRRGMGSVRKSPNELPGLGVSVISVSLKAITKGLLEGELSGKGKPW